MTLALAEPQGTGMRIQQRINPLKQSLHLGFDVFDLLGVLLDRTREVGVGGTPDWRDARQALTDNG